MDALFVGATLLFFVLTWGLLALCGRLQEG